MSDQMDPIQSVSFLFFCLVKYRFIVLGSICFLRGNWEMGKCRGRKEAAFKHIHIKKSNERGAAMIF